MAFLHERDRILKDEDFKKRLLFIAQGKIRNTEDAEDIVQDTLLSLMEMSEENILGVASLTSYVAGILKLKIIKWFNEKSGKQFTSVKDIEAMGRFTDPLIKMQFEELERAVSMHKSKTEQMVFDLHFKKGITDPEIAAIIHKKPGNVRKKIFNIRTWVRKHFKNE